MRLPITSSIASWPITATIPGMMQLSNLGESKVRELMRDGPLETVVIGGRRLVVVASYLEDGRGGTRRAAEGRATQ